MSDVVTTVATVTTDNVGTDNNDYVNLRVIDRSPSVIAPPPGDVTTPDVATAPALPRAEHQQAPAPVEDRGGEPDEIRDHWRTRVLRRAAEADQRAALLRRQVEHLTAQLTAAEAELVSVRCAHAATRDAAARLRALLAEALDGWSAELHDPYGLEAETALANLTAIRREAGLT